MPMQRFTRLTPRRSAAAVLAFAALSACDAPPTAGPPADESQELAALVEALGFRGDMVQDFGTYVLVEGDIYITKEQLRRAGKPLGTGPLGPRFQYRTTGLVGSPKVNNITVDVSGLASEPGWQTAAREALTHWSGISNSYVRMVEGSPADITVATTCTSSNVAAFASFPSGGNPGSTIYVNACFAYSTSHAQKVHNMVHEFGHTLGFRHSNYVQNGETAGTEGAVHVTGTPTSGNDPGSVMNGGTALNSWAGFSTADLAATRVLYPPPAPPPPLSSDSLTVTNSGGYPLISWPALTGASSYNVARVIFETHTNRHTTESTTSTYVNPLGSTTGTTFLDSSNPYTGVVRCSYLNYPWVTRYFYYYRVTASFSDGTTTTTSVNAPIAPC